MSQTAGATISVESRWFKIAVFAGSAVAAGVTFANIIYYAKLRKDTKMTAISQNTATTMMWVNIVLFVVSLLLLIWSVWALLFSKEKREAMYASAKHVLVSEAPVVPQAKTSPPPAATVTVKA